MMRSVFVAAFLAVACVQVATAQYASISAAVNGTATLSILRAAIDAAGLTGTLTDGSLAYTVFAPTDTAFAAALAELKLTPAEILANTEVLTSILAYHVVPSAALKAEQIPSGTTSLATLAGAAGTFTGGITVNKTAAGVQVIATGNVADVIIADVTAGAAVVHVVDAVLYPFFLSIAQAAVSTPALSTLVAGASAAGLVPTLSDSSLEVTVFAPTNDAFTKTLATLNQSLSALVANPKLLTEIITYHVVEGAALAEDVTNGTAPTLLAGKSLTFEKLGSAVIVKPISGLDANVIIADIPIGPGPRSVVHVVDQVLSPTFSSVAQAASATPDVSILLAAIVAEGSYVAALSDPAFVGTVFAPTNEAFMALLAELKVDPAALLADKALVKAVLENHVIPGRSLRGLRNGAKLPTLAGPKTISFSNKGGVVRVSTARTTAKVVARNVDINFGRATVHVIDKVLLPGPKTARRQL